MEVIHIIIICSVVGGVVLIALTFLVVYCACRRAGRKSRQNQTLDDTEDSQTKSSDIVQHTPTCGSDNAAFSHAGYVPDGSNGAAYETSQSETVEPRSNLISDDIPKTGPASLYSKIGESVRNFEHIYNTSSTSGLGDGGKKYVYGVDETSPYATVDIIHMGGDCDTRPEGTCVIHDVTEHGANTASDDRLGHSTNVYYELERASNASSCTLSEADVQDLGFDNQDPGSDDQDPGSDDQDPGSDVYANTNTNLPLDPEGQVHTNTMYNNDTDVKYLQRDYSLEDEMYVNNAMLTSAGAASGALGGDGVPYSEGREDRSYVHFKETDDSEETWA